MPKLTYEGLKRRYKRQRILITDLCSLIRLLLKHVETQDVKIENFKAILTRLSKQASDA